MDPDELMRELAEKMGQSAGLFGHTMAGMTMSARDAEAVERSLQQTPDDLEARAKLLAYYGNLSVSAGAVPPQAVDHIRWLIENAPGCELAGTMYAQAPGTADAAELLTLWRYAADDHPDDAQVQANAARFFAVHDAAPLAQLYWERARSLDPSLPEKLPSLFPELESVPTPDIAQPPVQDRPQFRFYAATEEVEEALRHAVQPALREHAERLLKTAESFRDNWNYGNAIFYGHTALGLVALAEGDHAAAARELLLSATTPGSPQLGSFGPNLILAQQLLDLGDRAAVLTFFDRCAVWWQMGRGKLDGWRKAVHEGRSIDLRMHVR